MKERSVITLRLDTNELMNSEERKEQTLTK